MPPEIDPHGDRTGPTPDQTSHHDHPARQPRTAGDFPKSDPEATGSVTDPRRAASTAGINIGTESRPGTGSQPAPDQVQADELPEWHRAGGARPGPGQPGQSKETNKQA